MKPIPLGAIRDVKEVDEVSVESMLIDERQLLSRKIVVLDDDPTGIQTVDGVTVFTDWERESILQKGQGRMQYVICTDKLQSI